MNLSKKKFISFKENQITKKSLFLNRRKLILGLSGSILASNLNNLYANNKKTNYNKIIKRKLTSYENITKYNNFLSLVLPNKFGSKHKN